MGISMMKQSIKKALNPSFLFMGFVGLIIILYTYIGQNKANQVIGYSPFEALLRGLIFLFIIFANELSKDSLQEEKLSKRIEWYLANGIKTSTISLNHCLATFITTNMLMVPIIFIASYLMKEFLLGSFIEYLLITLLYSFLLNMMMLRTVNMNALKNIWRNMILVNFTLLILEFIFRNLLGGVAISLFKMSILSIICILLYRSTNEERVISAYY